MADELIDPLDIEQGETSTIQETPPASEGRPRNADGTFAAFERHVQQPDDNPLAHLPASLIEEARDFGYEDADLAEMSPSLLHKTLWKAKRQIEAARHKASEFVTRDQARQEVRNVDPRPKPNELDLPTEDDEDFDLGIDDAERDELHPTVIKAMKRIGGGYKKEIKALKGELAQRDQRERQRNAQRSVAMIDAAFAALPEYEKLYGKGDVAAVKGTPEFKRRLAVLGQAGVNANDPVSVGELKRQIKEATDVLFGPVLGETPGEDANPYAGETGTPPAPKSAKNGKPAANGRITREQWSEAALVRPTNRKVDDRPKTDQERTAVAVANLRSRLGNDNVSDADELEGFPD